MVKFKTPKRNRIRKSSGSEIVVFAIAFVILFSVGFSYIFSFFWGALSGLKTHNEIIMAPWGWPAALHFENYVDVFRLFEVNKTGMFGMIFNSLWLVGGGNNDSRKRLRFVRLSSQSVRRWVEIG